MSIFIRATANISPQETFGEPPYLTKTIEYTSNLLRVIKPDYKEIIDAKLLRRMSHVISMGVAAASACLKFAGGINPDAIVTGTAYGCMEESDFFLKKILEQNEEMLSPTAFIQSTHNTVGAQIALAFQCHQYNNTFVHSGFSFETALLDAIMLLQEDEVKNVLVGGLDELSDTSYLILNRFGLYKRIPVSNLELYNSNTKGTIAGEGAAFFLLTNKPSVNDYAQLEAISTFFNPTDITVVEDQIRSFLKSRSINITDIDLIITGRNGDAKNDTLYDHLERDLFNNKEVINYKHLCGEYPTSSSFALWLAATIIKAGEIPAGAGNNSLATNKINRVLIYNNYQNRYHSLLLVSASVLSQL